MSLVSVSPASSRMSRVRMLENQTVQIFFRFSNILILSFERFVSLFIPLVCNSAQEVSRAPQATFYSDNLIETK